MRSLGRTRPPTTNILEHMATNVGFELIHLPSFPSSGHLCVWFEQVQLISHLSMGSRLNVLPLHRDLKQLRVPKTLSVLITPRNHLTLQLPICFEVRALSGGLVSSTPE